MKRFTLIAAALLAGTAPAVAAPVAVIGGKLVIGDGRAPIDNGVVVIDNGRVIAAGSAETVSVPAGASIVVARGKWVTPGIVAGFSRVGLVEVDSGVEGADDTGASDSPHSAAIDASLGINPAATPIAVGRMGGVTRAIIAPSRSNSIFAGRGAVIDLGADYDPVTRARAFQLIDLGEGGAGGAGGSRPAAYLMLEEAFAQAAGKKVEGDRPDESLFTASDIEALKPVLAGKEKLMVSVSRASDILAVLKLKQRYQDLDMVLLGATEGWMVAERIAAAGVSVLADPIANLPGSFEDLGSTQSNIGRMRRAGVKVGVAALDDFVNRNPQNHRQHAGNLVALGKLPGGTGVSWDDAFAMISSAPAEIIGLGGTIGSLEPGARADVVVWSGDPLELSSWAEQVWVDGVEQPLVNHQTKLRDRYRTLERGALPKAYRK
ncbi:amidohydrolase family protein [Sphingomicrobium nitratireducens]|uniref:amidohydrolase family protein n=1 Tax=Sphingomicrobium nitratireducens TaxID=2964666 RepID=UPI00224064CC|nr:amidohydrolase family protein [Sphingomicrobium nitratireducens]